jgi:hypothetical protein
MKIKLSCPTTRHGGAWGERAYSSYSFTTLALDGGEWSASYPGHTFAPGKGPPVPILQEAEWAPEPVWTQRLEEKSSRFCQGSNLDHPVVQLIARHYTDWGTLLTTNENITDISEKAAASCLRTEFHFDYESDNRSLWKVATQKKTK